MKTTVAIAASLLLLTMTVISNVQAQGPREGKRKGARDGNQAANNRAQNRQRVQGNAGQGMGGMMQGGPNAAQMAQQLLANFDQNGNGALEQLELEQAMSAVMQRMQQMRGNWAMEGGQAMAGGMGMMGAAGQRGRPQRGGVGQNRMPNRSNRQFANGQRGGGKRGR